MKSSKKKLKGTLKPSDGFEIILSKTFNEKGDISCCVLVRYELKKNTVCNIKGQPLTLNNNRI